MLPHEVVQTIYFFVGFISTNRLSQGILTSNKYLCIQLVNKRFSRKRRKKAKLLELVHFRKRDRNENESNKMDWTVFFFFGKIYIDVSLDQTTKLATTTTTERKIKTTNNTDDDDFSIWTSSFRHKYMRTHDAAEHAKLAKWNIPLCECERWAKLQTVRVYDSVYFGRCKRPPYLISRKILRTFTIALAIRKNQMRIEFVWFVFFSFPPSHSIQCDSSKRILRNSCIVANYKLAQRVTFESHSNYVQHKIDKRKLYSAELLTFLLRKNT